MLLFCNTVWPLIPFWGVQRREVRQAASEVWRAHRTWTATQSPRWWSCSRRKPRRLLTVCRLATRSVRGAITVNIGPALAVNTLVSFITGKEWWGQQGQLVLESRADRECGLEVIGEVLIGNVDWGWLTAVLIGNVDWKWLRAVLIGNVDGVCYGIFTAVWFRNPFFWVMEVRLSPEGTVRPE